MGNNACYFAQEFHQMHSKYENKIVFAIKESCGDSATIIAHCITMGIKDLKDECALYYDPSALMVICTLTLIVSQNL